ncbi:GntR family transcriptional regulator [Streptomyces netropsis]|uniref:GntR family transcriptional regulator n=1 Tax=Streptomyces netropsis TaxID=55404 RepID=A0A7W7PHH6_STRNE|nr:GntR family transcriptional regulator [Streptomyces netropsis]MBB4890089.1 GntR family transcriptional regulator [Streptomyces netropsis]GGR43213.1 transcriptional regulator [Streptomyces netropsis]
MAKRYERIADALRQHIRAGQLKPGDRLPAETKLAEQYRTSVPTMREALAELHAEGLIDKRHGVGNFVRKPRQRVQRTNERHQWEKDRARQVEDERKKTGATEHDTGLTVSDLVFSAEFREARADADLADAFGVPVGTRLLERTYRTHSREEDAPFNVARSYLVHDVVAANPDLLDETKEPWPGGTQNQLYTVGVELDRVVERITARPPTVEEAEELGLQKGVSVIVLRKTSIDTSGRVVEISDVKLPGDRTELLFTTPLARW